MMIVTAKFLRMRKDCRWRFIFLQPAPSGRAIVLIAYGALVIGLVDNFLRPMLVAKDTKMRDYVVLFSTLGGIEAFGLTASS